MLLQLDCFPVLAVVPSGAEISGYVSIKILVVSTWLSRLQPSPDMRLKPAQAPGMGDQPVRDVRGNKPVIELFFLFFNLMPGLYWSIVDLKFFACH